MMTHYELSIRDYLQIVKKRKLVLIVISFAFFFLVVMYTNIQKPIYRASASIQWIERKPLGGMLTELVSAATGDPLLTQARVIRSRLVLSKVVEELGLVRKGAPPYEVIQKANALQGSVRTDVIENTNIIRIDVIYSQAEQAAVIANKIAEVYIAENIMERNKQNRIVREFIETQLKELNLKLRNSEDLLAKFKQTEAPSGAALSLENRLFDLETKRSVLLQQFTELHPDVIDLNEEIERIKEQLKVLPQKELGYSRMIREVEINGLLYKEIKGRLEAARIAESEKIEDVSLVESALTPLSPISPNRQLNYFFGIVIGLMLGLCGTFLVEQLDTTIGTIEDVESFLGVPALGIIPYLKTGVSKRKGLLRALFPKEIKGEEKLLQMRNQLLIHYSNNSPIFEAYRMLRTNIQTEVFKEKIRGKILLFSSSVPEEGKSINISNLAITIAQSGLRPILIDADMRRSTTHKIFGLKKREPGLCDILRGTAKFEETVRTFTDILTGDLGSDETLKVLGLDALNILTSGSLPTNPAELLSSPEMSVLLEKLREKYDLILIDTPPVLAVADAMILASKADGVILVYRVGMTARTILNRSKKQLLDSGAQLKGVILNNISPQIEMRYGYYHNYKYYGKYYEEKKKES